MGITMGHFGLKHTRDRLAGDLVVLNRQKQKLQAEVAELQAQLADIDTAISSKTSEIATLDGALQAVFDDSTAASPRQTFPKHHFTEWGGLTRGALAVLREANGETRTTKEIARILTERAGIQLETPADVQGFRRALKQRLAYLAREGKIERLHEQSTNGEGQWRL